VRFEISHEFEASIEALELAVLSPDLGDVLLRTLQGAGSGIGRPSIESVETVEHVLEGGALRRVLRFQASAPLPILKVKSVSRDAMSWEETWTYRLAEHASTWSVAPKPQYRRYFESSGTYRLEPTEDGRTRRVVEGDLRIHVALIGALAERVALGEVRKTYDAEANTLRELASL
jgi:hypothetical protein